MFSRYIYIYIYIYIYENNRSKFTIRVGKEGVEVCRVTIHLN